MNAPDRTFESLPPASPPTPTSQCIDWYHEGEQRTVEVDGVRITARFVGRRGRRGRIAIEAPPGARFLTLDLNEIAGAPGRSN